MANITVSVTDANNITVQLTPVAAQTITIDRGVAGNGISSIVPVTISTLQYLRIYYTNGTQQDVGPLTSTAYAGTSPIDITGNTISLTTVPINLGGTNATTAAAAIQNLLPSYTGNGSKRLGLNSGATALEWVADGGGTVTSVDFSGGTTGLTATGGPITSSGTITLAGTLAVANGGTNGTATPTAGTVSYGTGTAYAFTAAGTVGQILQSNGAAAPTWANLSSLGVSSFSAGSTGLLPSTGTTGAITLSGTLIAFNGGTGQSSYAVGDLLYASSTTALSKLADVATGNALISGGVSTAPSWGKIGLTTHVSGILPTANGGTNLTSFTANGVLYASSTSALATGSVLTFDGAILGVNGVSVGRGAGAVSTNTAVGASALAANTTGIRNVAVGSSALILNQDGQQNIAIGDLALAANVSGGRNIAIGSSALAANTGSYNTVVGSSAGALNTTGEYNSAFGRVALSANTTGAYNTAIGAFTLLNNTTASYNVAVGYQALRANTTGSGGTAVGTNSLLANTTGADNSAFGIAALAANTAGNYNTALGREALQANTTASNNTAVGYQAGYNNTTGQIDAFGNQALRANTTGVNNTGIGNGALYSNTTGGGNTAVGNSAALFNTTGNYNTALGNQAFYSNTTASYNTAVGYQALYTSNRTADANGYNTAMGSVAGQLLTTGQYNTFVGGFSGQTTTTGTFNSFYGVNSGYLVTTGSKNTIIGGYSGNQGGLDIRTASNYIVLSDGDGNPRGIFDGSGNFEIGSSSQATTIFNIRTTNTGSPIGKITFSRGTGGVNGQVYYDQSTDRLYCQAGGSGGVYLAGGGTSWTSASDERVKDIIEPITDAANKVATLRAVIGKYKTDAEGIRRSFLIAQDVQAVLPEAVNATNPDEIGVAYTDVIPLLVAAIKELKAEVDSLKSQLNQGA